VRVLAQEIARARARGQSVASADALARYTRRRRGENATMLAAMQGFQRLFGDTHPAVRLVRNLGLGAVDRLAPIKRAFMREAMGL
jgi:2-octaprenylphenol hydroxylase